MLRGKECSAARIVREHLGCCASCCRAQTRFESAGAEELQRYTTTLPAKTRTKDKDERAKKTKNKKKAKRKRKKEKGKRTKGHTKLARCRPTRVQCTTVPAMGVDRRLASILVYGGPHAMPHPPPPLSPPLAPCHWPFVCVEVDTTATAYKHYTSQLSDVLSLAHATLVLLFRRGGQDPASQSSSRPVVQPSRRGPPVCPTIDWKPFQTHRGKMERQAGLPRIRARKVP